MSAPQPGVGFRGINPMLGSEIGEEVHDASPADVGRLASAAADAFAKEWQQRTFSDAALLRAVARALERSSDRLRDVGAAETGLSLTRLDGELARTTGQLRAFADLVEDGTELDAIVETADPDATPPRPDQRRVMVPLGPVAVFAASNFPFAFSVAGGDTAAAWAAGCPVLLKAHPAHPGTSQLTAELVSSALGAVGAPEGWFALIHGRTPATGQALVEAKEVEALAFTGSFAAGTALARVAAGRERPIPAYVEMGSLNPVLLTREATRRRAAEIAEGLATAVIGSVGQLCTKPGLIALCEDDAGRSLVDALAARLSAAAQAPMLYEGLRDGFADAFATAATDQRVLARVTPAAPARDGAWQGPGLLEVRARDLEPTDRLLTEIFGPAAVVVWCADDEELTDLAARVLPGSLTATLHTEDEDPVGRRLAVAVARNAGRVILNGYPTGVTVGHATVHGGPHPATTNSSHTSVGMTAIRRFLRPVGYQAFSDSLLPEALRDDNPLRLVRRVNGTPTRAPVVRT